MLKQDELKLEKKALVGKRLKILSIRDDYGKKMKPFFWINVALDEQSPHYGVDENGKKTMLNSDRYLEMLRNDGKLGGALLKLEEFVKPKHGFWYFKYAVLQEGKNPIPPAPATPPEPDHYRGRKDSRESKGMPLI